ncbi:hypothetical protein [Kitasatospora sp. NPDC001175]|uniref:hypothetical protein n=1 Tax=Kitasatospora sp. NPDC001175 TaxID=3157103 RepID=UPI003CFEDCCA
MPEYLTPGVYVEETSFRSRSIEGVPTSTFGMAGRTEYGPVPYSVAGTTVVPGPALVTSFTEYERAFGGLSIDGDPCWLALAARAFFANGGRRLYVSRVFSYTMTGTGPSQVIDQDRNFAALALPLGAKTPLLRWRARWPGTAGARINVSVAFRRSKNVLVGGRLTGVQPATHGSAAHRSARPAARRPAGHRRTWSAAWRPRCSARPRGRTPAGRAWRWARCTSRAVTPA